MVKKNFAFFSSKISEGRGYRGRGACSRMLYPFSVRTIGNVGFLDFYFLLNLSYLLQGFVFCFRCRFSCNLALMVSFFV